jgi:hypothetical protein
MIPVQTAATDDALSEFRKKSYKPGQPQVEVRKRHPDLGSVQHMQDRECEPEDGVVGLVIGQQLIQQFGEVYQSQCPRVAHL